MKNTIKRDKLGAVIAPTTKEENIFWANRKEIMAKSKAEGRDLDATAKNKNKTGQLYPDGPPMGVPGLFGERGEDDHPSLWLRADRHGDGPGDLG